MTSINTITLELLRRGPAHNQLLSPLTDYLSLCGNYGATTLNVPWEHGEFTQQLAELRYPRSADDNRLNRRKQTVTGLSRAIARILHQVPGLQAGLANSRCQGQGLTHLRLVVSASELALLPFELSKVISATPGPDDSVLSLDSQQPVCITRQVRSTQSNPVQWPKQPKILFAYANAGGSVPFQAHVQKLFEAIKPWMSTLSSVTGPALKTETEKYLTILPNASISDIGDACAKQDFTHVHILAHGTKDTNSPGEPVGIALHDPKDPARTEIVEGQRLATALCSNPCQSGPVMVTMASCDSGELGDPIHSGASFAHNLHQAGIPLVVASQFPLTFSGSVLMVEKLYGEMLWGKNPYCILHQLRSELYQNNSGKNHDWASLVVYENLPDNLEEQLNPVRYEQTRQAINRIMADVDEQIGKERITITHSEIDQRFTEINELYQHFPNSHSYQIETLGLKGAIAKRRAEALFKVSTKSSSESQEKDQSENDDTLQPNHWLEKALKYYQKASKLELSSQNFSGSDLGNSLHWLLTQQLVLRLALGKPFKVQLWHSAVLSAETDRYEMTGEQLGWSHASLCELYLLLLAYLPDSDKPQAKDPSSLSFREKLAIGLDTSIDQAKERTEHHARMLKRYATSKFSIDSTVRQLKRYTEWWCQEDKEKDQNLSFSAVNKQAHVLVQLLKQEEL